MPRRFTLLLLILISVLLAACSKQSSEGSSQPVASLAEGKIGALRIVGVKVAPSLTVSSQDTAEKLDAGLRPANPGDTRNIVVELTIESDTLKEMLPLPCGSFMLTYDGGSAPCVGLSFGDQWILATSGSPEIKLIYNEPGETREEKLLFLVPKHVEAATLELKSTSGPPARLARLTLP